MIWNFFLSFAVPFPLSPFHSHSIRSKFLMELVKWMRFPYIICQKFKWSMNSLRTHVNNNKNTSLRRQKKRRNKSLVWKMTVRLPLVRGMVEDNMCSSEYSCVCARWCQKSFNGSENEVESQRLGNLELVNELNIVLLYGFILFYSFISAVEALNCVQRKKNKTMVNTCRWIHVWACYWPLF